MSMHLIEYSNQTISHSFYNHHQKRKMPARREKDTAIALHPREKKVGASL